MSKLQSVEWITLNIASIGWVIIDIFEYLPAFVTILVGLSIVFLNIARGIMAIKNKNPKK